MHIKNITSANSTEVEERKYDNIYKLRTTIEV